MGTRGIQAVAQGQTPEEIQKDVQEHRAKALADFPFKLMEVPGKDALAKWQELKSAGNGTPIILGGGEHFHNILYPFAPYEGPPEYSRPAKSLQEVVAAAEKIRFPDDLIAKREREVASARAAVEAMRNDPKAWVPTIIQLDKEGIRIPSVVRRPSLLCWGTERTR
jgi:hypothetical protein